MPLKRESTATRIQLCVRPTQTCVKNVKRPLKRTTDNYNTEVIRALKENNDSLAAALDKCRQDLRDLHEDFVVLQKERQQLLEIVLNLESKLCNQQRQISEQICPVLKLLSQSEKSLSATRQTLTALLTTKSSSGCRDELFSPVFSPIHNATESYYAQPHSSTLLSQAHVEKRQTKRFPKTPHPVLAVSTPEEVQQSLLSCEPKALNFDEEVSVIQCADTPLPTSVEPGDLMAAIDLSDINEEIGKPQADTGSDEDTRDCEREATSFKQRPRRACAQLSVSHQETVIKSKSTKSNSSKSITKQKAASELSTKAHVDRVRSSRQKVSTSPVRPRRACSSLSISYQEPNLKHKLRCENHTSTSVVSARGKPSESRTRRIKCPLQDVTNKKL